jgi:hypothetical protein
MASFTVTWDAGSSGVLCASGSGFGALPHAKSKSVRPRNRRVLFLIDNYLSRCFIDSQLSAISFHPARIQLIADS